MSIAGMSRREYNQIVYENKVHREWKRRRKHAKREKWYLILGVRIPLWRDRP